jgi:segregation and condensation protein B
MMRVEAVIFAASQPVSRETLSALIGSDCNLDLLIADIRDELRSRPYELVDVAGGFQHRTRRAYAEVIRASGTVAAKGVDLTQLEKLVLTAVAYFQPITRAGLGDILGRNISRDVIAALRGAGLVATGPRSPQPGAPHTYVTTPAFLALVGEPARSPRPRPARRGRPAQQAAVAPDDDQNQDNGANDQEDAMAQRRRLDAAGPEIGRHWG